MTTASFAFIAGIFYIGLGLLGLLPSMMLNGYLLGAFATGIALSVLYAFLGIWGLVAWSGAASPVTYSRSLAGIMAVLTVMGLLAALQNAFGILPLHGANVWLHGVTALLAAYFGYRSTTVMGHAERRRNANDRRQAARPVGQERRHGAYDRRHAAYGGSTLAAG